MVVCNAGEGVCCCTAGNDLTKIVMVGVAGKVDVWAEVMLWRWRNNGYNITLTLIYFLFFFGVFQLVYVDQIMFRVIILYNHGAKTNGLVFYIVCYPITCCDKLVKCV